jgi:hypothetical protein
MARKSKWRLCSSFPTRRATTFAISGIRTSPIAGALAPQCLHASDLSSERVAPAVHSWNVAAPFFLHNVPGVQLELCSVWLILTIGVVLSNADHIHDDWRQSRPVSSIPFGGTRDHSTATLSPPKPVSYVLGQSLEVGLSSYTL